MDAKNKMRGNAAMLRVTIAIPTFQRPAQLELLLDSLPTRIEECKELAQVDVLVVDNDPEASAQTMVAAHPLSPRYLVEPTPGIAAARNRLLLGSAESDLLAFIDDDEVPRPNWLRALLEVWIEYRPAAVMGRVISIFDDDVDPWILASKTFYRPPRPTGMVLEVAATGNLLLDMAQVRQLDVQFDEELGLGGGEDTLFSRLLVQRGGVIRWCNESVTEDAVAVARLTRSWAQERAYSSGNASVRVSLLLASSRVERAQLRARFAVGGVTRILLGFLRHHYGRLRRHVSHDARGMRLNHRGRGMLAGALGQFYDAYQR